MVNLVNAYIVIVSLINGLNNCFIECTKLSNVHKLSNEQINNDSLENRIYRREKLYRESNKII